MMEALKKYEVVRPVIERCNRRVLEILEASHIREARIAAESFSNGGKRLRPMLMFLSSMACNGARTGRASTPLIELAAAVELVHLATLFHDDVIDEVESRRMVLSARAKYGNYISVLAGDYVLSEALLLAQSSGVSAAMPEFLRTIQVLVSGESRETNHQFDVDMDEAIYYNIISEKSASLFELSCKIGGITEASDRAEALGKFGWNLGMAFQMIDDLDDMVGLTNGSMDCDLKNGYLALPVIRVLSSLQDGHRDSFVDLLRNGDFTPEEETRIVALCLDHGGIRHAHNEIKNRLSQAHETLADFDRNEGVQMLGSILTDLKDYSDAQAADFALLVNRCSGDTRRGAA